MKRFYLLLVLSGIFSSGLWAQSEGTKIKIKPPRVVNFTQMANYERAHPPQFKRKVVEQGEDKDKRYRHQPGPVPADAIVFNRSLPSGSRTVSPAPMQQFNGILDNGSTIPPDIRGAVGDQYIVQSTNQQINIYTKTGGLHSAISLNAFFFGAGGMTGSFFDPHVEYDPIRQRFVACTGGDLTSAHSGVFLAVSETSDPTGNWYVYGFDGTGNTSDLLDYPLLGFNSHWVVITGNDFTSSGVIGKIFVFNRDSVYTGHGTSVTVFTDNDVFAMSPAVTLDSNQFVEYMVQNIDGSQAGIGYVQISTITGTPNAPVYTPGPTLGINHPWADNGNGVPQSGNSNTLEDGDSRIDHSVYINGSMWFSHTVYLPSNNPNRCGVDWWQVDPAGPSIIQFGRLFDLAGVNNYFYSCLNVNNQGDAILSYCQSSTQMFASASYSFRAAGDPINTMQDSYLYKAGLGPYYKTFGGSRNRWGDYTGTAVDPVNQSFWTFGQWANTGNNWATHIANILASNDSTCYPPFNTSSTEITDTSVRLSWVTFAPAAAYIVGYRISGDTTWTTDTTGQTTLVLTGLAASTLYEWQVQSVCTSGDSSVPTSASVFLTRMNCALQNPVVTQGIGCPGESVALSASGVSVLSWHADTAGARLDTGSTFLTPPLSTSTTYYVRSVVNGVSRFVGPVDSTLGGNGTGSYIVTHSYHNLLFNCANPTILVSVKVYAQVAGNRTITLKQNGGLMASKTVSIPSGESRINLGFEVPAGTNFELGCQGFIGLYHNTAGASYPYTLDGVISIIGNDVDTGYYFFFYDWELQEPPCRSAFVPVPAVINTSVVSSFHLGIAVDTVLCSDSSAQATSWLWTFGDVSSGSNDTSTLQNPYHVYAGMDSVYTICLTVTDSVSGCSSTSCQQILVGGVGVTEAARQYFTLYPNPVQDRLTLEFGPAAEGQRWEMSMTDVSGREVAAQTFSLHQEGRKYEIDVSTFAAGTYVITLRSGEKSIQGKIVVR